MKKIAVKKILTVLALMILSTAILVSAVYAETAENGEAAARAWKDRLLTLPKFTFQRHKNGIGRGECPVYTAPSEDALRLANNRLVCDTDQDLYEAGYTEEGWLLVRYESSAGKIRVGYIPPRFLNKFKSSMSAKKFGRIPVTAANTIPVADNPVKAGETITELAAGDSFAILAKYTYHGNWWYIECTAGGKTARGFIDRESSALYPGGNDAGILSTPVTLQDLGTPGISPLGTEQAGEIVVNGREGDERKLVHKEPDSEGKWVSVVYPARHYPYYGTKDAKRSTWYYVFVEEDSAWGWVRSTFCTPVN